MNYTEPTMEELYGADYLDGPDEGYVEGEDCPYEEFDESEPVNDIEDEIGNQIWQLEYELKSHSDKPENQHHRQRCQDRIDYLQSLEDVEEVDSLEDWRAIQGEPAETPPDEKEAPKRKGRLHPIPNAYFNKFWAKPLNQAIMNNVARRYMSSQVVQSLEVVSIKLLALWRAMSGYDSDVGNWNGYLKAVTTGCFKDMVLRTPKEYKLINELNTKVVSQLDDALTEHLDDYRSADKIQPTAPKGRHTTSDIEQKVCAADTDISKGTNAFDTLREIGGFDILIDYFESGLNYRDLAKKYKINKDTVGSRIKDQLSEAKSKLESRGLDISTFLS